MGDSRGGGQRVRHPTPLKNHKNKGFLTKTGPDRLKNHKATKPAFIVGSSAAQLAEHYLMANRWRVDDRPLIVVFVWIISPLKIFWSKLDPLWQIFLDARLPIDLFNHFNLNIKVVFPHSHFNSNIKVVFPHSHFKSNIKVVFWHSHLNSNIQVVRL